jgi:undecaprenyl diphosphate synthase
MDGNGRWAQKRGLPRTQGHLEGLKAGKQIVRAATEMGIDFLTLYVFSTENWKRAEEEVGFVMGLVRQYLKSEFNFCRENNIRVRHAGDPSKLPPDVARDIADVVRDTTEFSGMQVVMALNYGGRDEIIRAVNKALAADAAAPLDERRVAANLDNPDIPDPDLIIRTADEFRTSNFLLWEAAYSEYYISPKLWPDFTPDDLAEALSVFKSRERKFGGVPQYPAPHNTGNQLSAGVSS